MKSFHSKYILNFLNHKCSLLKKKIVSAAQEPFLAASYQIDAFDKTDGFSRKPKLDTGVVSKETTVRVLIRPPIIEEKER